MQHRVYLAISLGAPRDHHALFIPDDAAAPADSPGPGTVFQAAGSIQHGMTFEVKTRHQPESSPEFLRREYLGWVAAADLPRVRAVCEAVPPPKKQFDGARRLFPGEPLRRCQEWTREAVDALAAAGVLHTEQGGSTSIEGHESEGREGREP
ncbi:hypothetical protein ISF_09261 [Cordyceps fumosorosea ARSEF 2679]|uniref:Uncharacterized protein n=1 Tax=Cordyceps fumosorosea (strain ARSEF 2679) TaxID=1081104 RepID=A0A162K3M5_CORFA|nr:hypothetical protein ISF_09261 [Cordyceps fumosorosea ARSEF 2679]OAA52878.1 hypothetical protein ISF_09261 [Cordyceps fumosorosea ARSEF 2679]